MSGSPKQRRKFCFCPPRNTEMLPNARATQQRSCFSSTSHTIPESFTRHPAPAKHSQHDDSRTAIRRRGSHEAKGPMSPKADRVPMSSTADRGPTYSRADRGPMSSTADRGPMFFTPDRGQMSSTADRGPMSSTPDRGRMSSTADRGPMSSTPDRGPMSSTPDRGPMSFTPDRGLMSSTADRGGGVRDRRGGFTPSTSSSSPEAVYPRTSTTSRHTYTSRIEVDNITSPSRVAHQHRCQLQQLIEEAGSGDSAKINCKLNDIFVKRLRDIDSSAEGDPDLKLVTYQEWIDMLLKINETVISNMQGLEEEVSEKLELVQRKANDRSGEGSDVDKYRKDIATLLTVVQNGYHHSNWNIKDLTFETINHEDIFTDRDRKTTPREGGVKQNSMESEAAHKNKLMSNVRALAIEVAERHDELRDVKRQILCLEDEIQNAQRKILLKDDVIKELRSDLRFASSKLSDKTSTSTLTHVAMPPINFDSETTARSTSTQVAEGLSSQHQLLHYSVTDDDCAQFESLAQTGEVEQQKLKVLEEELNELFEMTKDMKKQNYEFHKKRLSDIFQKSELEKAAAYRRLNFLRSQLSELESKHTDPHSSSRHECDSGFSSKSENDKDAKILEGVRKRIRKMNEGAFEMKKRVQQLEIENNELTSKLETEKSFVSRNSETLKQVADLLCDMTGEQFYYNDIYNAQPQSNPFCDVILKLERMRVQRENQLSTKIENLEETLYKDELEINDLVDRLSSSDMSAPKTVTTTTTNTATILQRAIHVQQQQYHQHHQQQHQQHVKQSTREHQQRSEDNRNYDTDDNNKSNSKNNTSTHSTSATTTTTTTSTNSNNNFRQFTWNW